MEPVNNIEEAAVELTFAESITNEATAQVVDMEMIEKENIQWPTRPDNPFSPKLEIETKIIEARKFNGDIVTGRVVEQDSNNALSESVVLDTTGSNGLSQEMAIVDISAEQASFIIEQIDTLQGSQRTRMGKLHYFDHPRMGVLIQVNEYKMLASETDQVEASEPVSTPISSATLQQ